MHLNCADTLVYNAFITGGKAQHSLLMANKHFLQVTAVQNVTAAKALTSCRSFRVFTCL